MKEPDCKTSKIFQSKYKSLHISEKTSVDDLIQILLNCYNSKERKELFSIYVVRPSEEYQRKLHHEDLPLQVQQSWGSHSDAHFRLQRNPYRDRPKRKHGVSKILNKINLFTAKSIFVDDNNIFLPLWNRKV